MIRKGNYYIARSFQQNTLATKAGIKAWINGAIDKIFFPIGQLFEAVFPLFYIKVASAASTNTTTIMMKFNVVFERYFEEGITYRCTFNGHWF